MMIDYKRNMRKLIALVIAIICYFVVHEGAHLHFRGRGCAVWINGSIYLRRYS